MTAKADFAALLRHHQTQLFGYIYSLVRDLDDADDLFQQTSLVLWDKFEQFDPLEELHQLGVWRGAIRGVEFPAVSQSKPPLLQRRAQPGFDRGPRIARARAARGAARCPGRLHEKTAARDHELLETCYGRSVCIQEVARAWGRSTHSIHNSLRRIRRVLFECVRRSLAQGGLA